MGSCFYSKKNITDVAMMYNQTMGQLFCVGAFPLQGRISNFHFGWPLVGDLTAVRQAQAATTCFAPVWFLTNGVSPEKFEINPFTNRFAIIPKKYVLLTHNMIKLHIHTRFCCCCCPWGY
jgi:hypothetical protein